MASVGIVIPWFGADLKGGAEQQAWQVATRLARRGHAVEVLTTCCRAFTEDWGKNHLPAGLSRDGGLAVRRFPVERGDRGAFNRVNLRLLALDRSDLKPGVSPVSRADAETFVEDNVQSAALLAHLRQHREGYRAFLFLPYLYGPTLKGLPLVADRAYLQPCLHDEAYAYLPQVDHVVRCAKGLLFNSEGEAELAARLYGPAVWSRGTVVGEGVEVDAGPEPADRGTGRFVLYLGRRDATKNVDLLVRAYARFRRRRPDTELQLLLAGPGRASYSGEGVTDLGLVGEAEKRELLWNCQVLFQPSRNESYSRAIMEAWLCGRPVAAHRDCLATAGAVARAGGGWVAGGEDEWAQLFETAERATDDELGRLGAGGRRYAAEHADWERVIDRYEAVLGLRGEPARPAPRPGLREVHQLLPSVAYGDAISDHALAVRDRLLDLGYRSRVIALNVDPRVADRAEVFRPGGLPDAVGLLYHHSIGTAVTAEAVRHPGPKCLVYHNITPARFQAPYRADLAAELERGRNELPRLARHFPAAVGDSAFNAAELRDCGFTDPGVLPIAVEPGRWNVPADPGLMRLLQDGRTNLLFVGRVAPNKCQHDLVAAFAHYLDLDPGARLILVGGYDPRHPYYRKVLDTVRAHGVGGQVVVTGHVTAAEVAAYYRTAHLFWCMSEHEGFCVPLIEAMWHDVPVLAYKGTAVPESLGDARVLFTDKGDPARLAGLAALLVRDRALCGQVIRAQRERRRAFLPEAVRGAFDAVLRSLERQHDERRTPRAAMSA